MPSSRVWSRVRVVGDWLGLSVAGRGTCTLDRIVGRVWVGGSGVAAILGHEGIHGFLEGSKTRLLCSGTLVQQLEGGGLAIGNGERTSDLLLGGVALDAEDVHEVHVRHLDGVFEEWLTWWFVCLG